MHNAVSIICYVTTDCNLDCSYCYTRAVYPKKQWIKMEDIEQLVQNCARGFDSVEFCWHGGEPLLAGRSFYREAISAQNRFLEQHPSVKFINTIQSNCLLLNDDWIKFLKENRFHVGSTFEAPPDVHLRHRPAVSGRRTSIDDYLSAFKRIKDASLPLGLLCVITKENVGVGKEIFDFFKDIKANTYSLLPLIETPRAHRPEPPSNEELYELYKTTFELRMSATNVFKSIEPIDTIVRALLGSKPRLCTFASPCLRRMASITPDGVVLPCGSLSEFPLGNIFKKPLAAIFHGEAAARLRNMRTESVNSHCEQCRYRPICRGGCRELAFWHSGTYSGKFPYCEARQKTFEYIEKRLREMTV